MHGYTDPTDVDHYRLQASRERQIAERSEYGGVRQRAMVAALAWEKLAARAAAILARAATRKS